MDLNEMANQLSNNPQMLLQLLQTMQQNGMIPQNNNMPMQRPQMNWNVPTNPMAAMWWNNMMNNAMNNNQGNQQTIQNQNQQQMVNQSEQKVEDKSEDTILPIRIVKSPDDIKIDQIPMSDKINLFLQEDNKVIYGKQWTNNGTMKNLRFVLVEEETNQNTTNNSGNTTVNNSNLNVEELMTAIVKLIDEKLDKFKKDYIFDDFDNKGQPKNDVK